MAHHSFLVHFHVASLPLQFPDVECRSKIPSRLSLSTTRNTMHYFRENLRFSTKIWRWHENGLRQDLVATKKPKYLPPVSDISLGQNLPKMLFADPTGEAHNRNKNKKSHIELPTALSGLQSALSPTAPFLMSPESHGIIITKFNSFIHYTH